MRILFLAAAMAALVFSAVPAAADPPDWAPAHGWRAHHHHEDDEDGYRPRHREDDDGEYDYRPRRHEMRVVADDERIYRGRDGRYYCRRSDGTMGLVVGAAVGGLIGNRIAPGHSAVLGTILGAGAGALLGQAIERQTIHCE